MSTYDLPEELPVSSDGLTRIVALDRPEELDPNNGVLHAGRAARWPGLERASSEVPA